MPIFVSNKLLISLKANHYGSSNIIDNKRISFGILQHKIGES